ncbi:MAG: glycosyltransferase family 4 protein [Candidatus Hodarchaeota archaeon]
METNSRNKLKLLVLCQLFYPELVSTGQTLTELCEVLSDSSLEVEVVCGPPTISNRKTRVPLHLEYKRIKIRRVWGTRFSKLTFLGKLINHVTYISSVFFYLLFEHSKRPILVLTNPPLLGVICAILRAIGGKPYIYLVFDVYPDTAINLGLIKEKGMIARHWDWWNRFIFKHASSIIVIGRCMREVIIKKGKKLYSFPDKVQVVHIWSDDRLIQPIPRVMNPFVKKWNLNGKFVVVYSGNMGLFHDMETIMEATKELTIYKDIEFLFIGEGHKKRWMKEFASKWNLANCQFHTYVDRRDLGSSLSCAHVGLVSLAAGQEGLSVPSKTFGILAAGVPVIGIMSRNSEVALILEENRCGIVTEPGNVKGLMDAIITLYSDSNLRNLMGKNGRDAINKKYNLIEAAIKYKSIIDSVQRY